MMYNQKTTRCGALRPLLLLPALGAAFWISQLPVVASSLEAVSSSELTLMATDGNKVTENPESVQIVKGLPTNSENTTETSAFDSEESVETSTAKSAKEPTDADNDGDSLQTQVQAQQWPQFPGGPKAMMDYVITHTKYPEGSENIKGRVVVRFEVKQDGSIGDTEIIKSLDPRFDAEAIRVVKSFPKLEPGRINGKPVSVWYALPVSFTAVIEKGKPTTKLPENTVIYVDGELFTGNLDDINSSDIESMEIDKAGKNVPAPTIYITTKK